MHATVTSLYAYTSVPLPCTHLNTLPPKKDDLASLAGDNLKKMCHTGSKQNKTGIIILILPYMFKNWNLYSCVDVTFIAFRRYLYPECLREVLCNLHQKHFLRLGHQVRDWEYHQAKIMLEVRSTLTVSLFYTCSYIDVGLQYFLSGSWPMHCHNHAAFPLELEHRLLLLQ